MFARAVDAGEGLLVQQASQTVLVGGLFQHRHDQLLVIGGEVGRLEKRRDLELTGRDFVVAGLGRDAEFEEFAVDFIHESHDAIRNQAEVVVLEFLPLRRGCAEERAAGRKQVGAREEEHFVYEEIFLLGSGRGRDAGNGFVAEKLEDAAGLFVQDLHRLEQRRFGVERLAGP